MYKLVVIAALVAVVLAEPGFLATSLHSNPEASSYSNAYRARTVKAAPLTYSVPIYTAPSAALAYNPAATFYNSAPYPYVAGVYGY